jgi:vacuolar-type H+-ATPase subunit I/STV1
MIKININQYIYIYIYIYIYVNIIYTKWDAQELLLKSSVYVCVPVGVCECLLCPAVCASAFSVLCASAFSVLHPSRAAPSCSLTIVI